MNNPCEKCLINAMCQNPCEDLMTQVRTHLLAFKSKHHNDIFITSYLIRIKKVELSEKEYNGWRWINEESPL
jgi:hypothetical protein